MVSRDVKDLVHHLLSPPFFSWQNSFDFRVAANSQVLGSKDFRKDMGSKVGR